MIMLMNEAVGLTVAEFKALPEYSLTLPTGTDPGRSWRRAIPPFGGAEEWWRGVYGKPYPAGHEHAGQVPIGWRRIVVLGEPARWPGSVPVPRRPVLGLRNAPEGTEEGELCMRGLCLGKLELRAAGDSSGCYCFKSAPCGHCMSIVPECPECGHREPEPC